MFLFLISFQSCTSILMLSSPDSAQSAFCTLKKQIKTKLECLRFLVLDWFNCSEKATWKALPNWWGSQELHTTFSSGFWYWLNLRCTKLVFILDCIDFYSVNRVLCHCIVSENQLEYKLLTLICRTENIWGKRIMIIIIIIISIRIVITKWKNIIIIIIIIYSQFFPIILWNWHSCVLAYKASMIPCQIRHCHSMLLYLWS
jgi:hypothetical protein